MNKQKALFFVLTGIFLFSINTNIYITNGLLEPVSHDTQINTAISNPAITSQKCVRNLSISPNSSLEFYSLTTDISMLRSSGVKPPEDEISIKDCFTSLSLVELISLQDSLKQES